MLWGNIACFEGLKRDFSTANLVEGDTVGCCIGNNGSLEYFVNGERKGIICHNVPSNKPLYGVADMCGRIKKIQSEFHFSKFPYTYLHIYIYINIYIYIYIYIYI